MQDLGSSCSTIGKHCIGKGDDDDYVPQVKLYCRWIGIGKNRRGVKAERMSKWVKEGIILYNEDDAFF